MIRIGLIGSQSMHASFFAKECNFPDENGNFLIPDCTIYAICGIDDDKEHTKKVADCGKIPIIVEKPEQLFSVCDAVMVLTRSGSNHILNALPFIKKGYPVFIDKPVCISDDDILILKNEISKGRCIIDGGSGMKHNSCVKEIKAVMDSGKLGKIKGISLNHNADINSQYDGIYFYACHGVEVMLTLLGTNPITVQTSVLDNKNFTAFFNYEDKFANLIFTVGYNDYFVNVYGEKQNISCRIDASDIFRQSLLNFVSQIKNGGMSTSFDDLIAHIYALRAMEKSLMRRNETRI